MEAKEDSDGIPDYMNVDSDAYQENAVKTFYKMGATFIVLFGPMFVVALTVIRPQRLEAGEQCGIPVIWWSEMWLTIFGFLGPVGLVIVIVALITKREDKTKTVAALLSVLTFFATIGWTTYGYFLIGSADNDCGSVEGMFGWYALMITLLCIGSIPYCFILMSILALVKSK